MSDTDDQITRLVTRNMELRAFLLRVLDPEDLGHAVSVEVREAARQALRIPVPSATIDINGPKQVT
jgi:DNA polymerase II small subunit/DNA polymerase delta subunit B